MGFPLFGVPVARKLRRRLGIVGSVNELEVGNLGCLPRANDL
jgi:hypothetical protein